MFDYSPRHTAQMRCPNFAKAIQCFLLPSCVLLLLLIGGCGTNVTTGAAASESIPTVAFAASPGSVTAGASSALTVTAANATQVTVTGDGKSYTLAANGGTESVTPNATTVYTATATGPGGTASSTATVTVMPASSPTAPTPTPAPPPTPAPAPTVLIQADPASVSAGSASSLTVTAANAAQLVVAGSDKSSYLLQANGGTLTVKPAATTVYTATATGAGGTNSSATTVTVIPNPAPTVSVNASAASVTAGSSLILSVAAANATQVTLGGTDGSSYTLPAIGGTQAVKPAETVTYTATATGPGGSISATVRVTVAPNPAPSVHLAAQPSSIVAQGSATLTAASLNATQVIVTGSDGSTHTLPSPDGGTLIVTPSASITYTATATGPGGSATATATVTVGSMTAPAVTLSANPATISSGHNALLTWLATNADSNVIIKGSDGSSYSSLTGSTGSLSVSPTATTTYTVTASGNGTSVSSMAVVTVSQPGSVNDINHVILMLQENHTFDNYFGMLNPYRRAMQWNVGDDGNAYNVDGIDDKLTSITNVNDQGVAFQPFKFASTCIDDESSAWLESYGDVNRYNFNADRPILMDGFVHNAAGFETSCEAGSCTGGDTAGKRAMGYYDQDFLNYYYYMASQFALSDRWFSPVSSKSISNRIATFSGGTTQGLTRDPGNDDQLQTQLTINNIFAELDQADVSWKIYYTVTQGFCLDEDDCLADSPNALYPATDFSSFSYSYRYLHQNPGGDPNACAAPTQASSVVGDKSNSFCIDSDHIAPLSQYYKDLMNGTLPAFSFIEAGYGNNDEHPGSGQSILAGQKQTANVLNAFMASPEWQDSVFFLSYDEGGGPYDHVPPVPGHSNDYTDAAQKAAYPDIASIAVNPDGYAPCVPQPAGTATLHCDLGTSDPGAAATDAAAVHGFDAQLGFRLPNTVISPFARRHYVSHVPMDHTAVIKFVENRFIPGSPSLTLHDAAQPDLLDFFDFNAIPWKVPPTKGSSPPPSPNPSTSSCTPARLGP